MKKTHRRLSIFFCLWMMLILLKGCVKGRVEYQVVYPSGYVRNPYIKDEITPVENTSYQLRCSKSEDYEETRAYDLDIDTNQTADIVTRFFLEEDKIWVSWTCLEHSDENGWEDIE